MRSWLFLSQAIIKAFFLKTSRSLILDPFSIKSLTMFLLPVKEAEVNGVPEFFGFTFGSEPRSRRAWERKNLSRSQEMTRGVDPCLLGRVGAEPSLNEIKKHLLVSSLNCFHQQRVSFLVLGMDIGTPFQQAKCRCRKSRSNRISGGRSLQS
jgi:hypothetical protein